MTMETSNSKHNIGQLLALRGFTGHQGHQGNRWFRGSAPGTPIAGWFIWRNHAKSQAKMDDDWGYPHTTRLRKPPHVWPEKHDDIKSGEWTRIDNCWGATHTSNRRCIMWSCAQFTTNHMRKWTASLVSALSELAWSSSIFKNWFPTSSRNWLCHMSNMFKKMVPNMFKHDQTILNLGNHNQMLLRHPFGIHKSPPRIAVPRAVVVFLAVSATYMSYVKNTQIFLV